MLHLHLHGDNAAQQNNTAQWVELRYNCKLLAQILPDMPARHPSMKQ
jgi:hypothetical protein